MVLKNKDILIRYLLGDLPEEDLERLAEEYFVKDEAWQALGAVESDLIDDYVRGQLPQALQQSFESRFMSSPERRERVEFARILMNSAIREQTARDATHHYESENSRKETSSSSYWIRHPIVGFGLTAAGLALFSIIAFLSTENGRLRSELKTLRSAQTDIQHRFERAPEEASNRPGRPSGQPTPLPLHPDPTISILLSPGVLRNSASKIPTLRLPAGRSPVELVLDLDHDRYAEYEAAIRTADGKAIQKITELKSRPIENGGRAVVLNIPSQILKNNEYVVTLFGRPSGAPAKVIDSYIFSVSRR